MSMASMRPIFVGASVECGWEFMTEMSLQSTVLLCNRYHD